MDVSTYCDFECDCDCEVLRNRVVELEAQVENLMDILNCTVNITAPYSSIHEQQDSFLLVTSQTDTVTYPDIVAQLDSLEQSTLLESETNNALNSEVDVQTVSLEADCSSEFSESATSSNPVIYQADSNIDTAISSEPPFELYKPVQPFSQFSMSELDKHTQPHYQGLFTNRIVAYYGTVPYAYGNVIHQPVPFEENAYLLQIVTLLRNLLPKYIFNSALITKFRDGNDYIGLHSDNEPSIVYNSDILTISLGETRTLVFEPIVNGGSKNRLRVNLTHGDLYGMTRKSQDMFRHSIWKDYSTQPRISITFRLLYPSNNPSYGMFSSSPSVQTSLPCVCSPTVCSPTACSTSVLPPPVPHQVASYSPSDIQPSSTCNTATNSQPTSPEHVISTVYISSSMFRNLNATKLSTDSQKAAVFYYPGATAEMIMHKLAADRRFNKIDPAHVKKVYLLCGTNNVDKILGIPRTLDKSIVEARYTKFSNTKFSQTEVEITNLLMYLNNWSPSAIVNVLNILPRASRTRNEVINAINHHISRLATNSRNINYISTELDRNMFCDNLGYRNSYLFNFRGEDNVHLNSLGQSKLAKFLKYHSHLS